MKPKFYKVRWEIEVGAMNEREAAAEALRVVSEPGSESIVFSVRATDSAKWKTVDLAAHESLAH